MTDPVGVIGGVERRLSPRQEVEGGESPTRSRGMDGVRELLSAARDAGLVAGNFRGLLHIAIGRTVTRPDGSTVSSGFTWRAVAAELKHLRFDTDLVREMGADPVALAARDRERFWYSAISLAGVDSPDAVADADRLAPRLKALGFVVGPAPAGMSPKAQKPKSEPKTSDNEAKSTKKKKR
jgi:hypothetical protein